MQTIVIGAVGLNGSGKDMVVMRLNSKFSVPLISIGDVVREIAKEEGIDPTRDNLHEISERYIAKYGSDYFPKRVISKIESEGWSFAGISGIRTPEDVCVFQDHYGKNFILVYVEVKDDQLRFERLRSRGEGRDPETFEEFQAQDASEEQIFRLQESISMATEKVNNDGGLEDLYAAVDELAVGLGLQQLEEKHN